ncbi:MAG: NAD(P)/FAD-dependent oxidoreductase [Bacteroidetes bacterium]|nr:NAD(P)/FAD-dependent oxidoreductase [Bacteroidota bacterium]
MIQKEIVIIGGGFAGVHLALRLSNNKAFHITLVDRNNYNFFPPLLYQVATGFLEASNICYPFRKLFQNKKNISFRMGEFQKLVQDEQKVFFSTCELSYDYLVFATGTETNFFGLENVKKNAIPMKNVNDALNMRNRYLQRLEQATVTPDANERKKLLNMVVAGGGPTGVEVSGLLAEMKRNTLLKDYPELATAGVESSIYLVDAGAALLAPMSPQSQTDTYKALEEMGVIIKLHTHVKDYNNDMVYFDTGETIETKTLIWAAGVTSQTFEGLAVECYGRGKRLIVDAYNKIQGTKNIYAIGDTCLQTTYKGFPNGHPQVAQVAIQQGKNLAANFARSTDEKEWKVFVYDDKGSMAIIGRNKAVADIPKPKLHFKGFIAWFMWVFVHLISLIDYRNRIKTLFNWMIAYFTKDQSLRMIIRPAKES